MSIIEIENLSKKYSITNLRQVYNYNSLGENVSNRVKRIFQKNVEKVKKEDFWALKDINFKIEQGNKIGIIGRNGAGKTTLLKILSRITEPTLGKIKIRGRIASLLEVGTGFHPELTGRENIYLNGSILGMKKYEIKRKFDEIVAFSEVEKFLDTPVKRYSSGMYVRLAFSVAAHLEPEILLVDEVLAVGDYEFQKKCLGKMEKVSSEGRTVLFVSHNMSAILNLCNNAILLHKGTLVKEGKTEEVIENYISSTSRMNNEYLNRFGDKKAEFIEYKLYNKFGQESYDFFMGDDIFVKLKIKFNQNLSVSDIGMNIKNYMNELFTHITSIDDNFIIKSEKGETKEIYIRLFNISFSPGEYFFDIAILTGPQHHDMIEGCMRFTLSEGSLIKRHKFPSHVKFFTTSKWSYFLNNIK